MQILKPYEIIPGTVLYLNGSLCTVTDIESNIGFWTKEIFFDFHRAKSWYDFDEDCSIPLLSEFTEEELILLKLGMNPNVQNIR